MKPTIAHLKKVLLTTVMAALALAVLCDIVFMLFGRRLAAFATDAF